VSWKVTFRHGPEVKRERFATLDQAVDEARGQLDAVRRGGRLGTVSMLREFTPDVRVQARVEISSPGLLRGREGGIDLMGDGSMVAYLGAIRKRRLEADTLDEALERLREALG
jgi:hypothetical protein